MPNAANPLISDATLSFMFEEFVRPDELLELDFFADHDRAGLELHMQTVTRFARERLYETYPLLDHEPPVLEDGRVRVHPLLRQLYPQLVELGAVAAERPFDVGGQQLPRAVATLASFPLMSANTAAVGFAYLTGGAAHLIEHFGDEELRETYMRPMYEGRWTGTMCLTEPHAGSSLSDITTRATPEPDGSYRLKGSKIFISGGDQDFAENTVHLALGRIEGAPAGTKGISLFVVPRMRPGAEGLVFNDVHTTQLIHKIGWKGLPSTALSFGEQDDCHGWRVGEAGRGLKYMFLMMNGARIFVGANGVATSAVAYQESLAYARDRQQGRPLPGQAKSPSQIPIIEHADVRRMLLRQKAIVEGGMALVLRAARWSDLAQHHPDEAERKRCAGLLELLTPIVKTFPAEWGYEANALALQIHGGYGYSSEYLPESWLRDQKLNSIHEGTTGIQGLDLLGRKVMAKGGADAQSFVALMATCVARCETGPLAEEAKALAAASKELVETSAALAGRAMQGDVPGMLLHSDDYLRMFSIITVAWIWLEVGEASLRRLDEGKPEAPEQGRLAAMRYWIRTELPRVGTFAKLCRDAEDSYAEIDDAAW